jgi:putative ABC transport system permease protein
MNINTLAVRNVLRNKFRTVATMTAVAIAILTFVLLRTLISAWTVGVEEAAQDRIATRHKVSFIMQLPKRYVDEIGQIPGVQSVAFASWFGGKDASHPNDFFATIATDPKQIMTVYDEMVVPEDQKAAFISNRRGALVGKAIAKKLGWKVGDVITLAGTIYPGDWQFEISAIYDAKRRSVDQSSLFFHYDYLNESLPESRKNQVGWVLARVNSAGEAASVARAIDQKFDERDIQTLSMSERAMNASFLGMLSAALKAIDLVSVVILLIMTLILGNTVAMGVRERTHEYGVLRAIGFLPQHLAKFVLGEAATVGLGGGLLGLAIAYPFVQNLVGRFLEENMGGIFPYVRIAPTTAVLAVVFAGGLGIVAAAVPAYRASKLDVIDALRRIG